MDQKLNDTDQERMLPSPFHKETSLSAFNRASIVLGRTPLAGLRIELTLLEFLMAGLFLGGNAGYIIFSFFTEPDGKHFAEGLGEVLQWDLALSLLFVTRNSIWQYLFSCSFERSVTYHRWISNTAILVGFVHMIAFYAIWLEESAQKWEDEAISDTENLFGEVALACYILLVVFSLPFVRRRLFELFRWAHFLLVPLFILCILLHHGGPEFLLKASLSIVFYGIDLGYRLYSTLLSGKSSAAVVSVKKVCNDVVKLAIRIDGGFSYSAGQYVFLTLPQVASFQAHPFTISSAPSDSADTGEFTVHVRPSGDFTFRLLRTAEMRPSALCTARVEGPYGALSINPFAYRRVVFVAGGIGITPMLALMRDMVAKGAPSADRVSLHWSIPQLSLYHAFREDLVPNDAVFETHVYVTHSKAGSGVEMEQDMVSGVTLHQEGGRPNVAHIIDDEARLARPGRVGVLVCGPESMRSAVLFECSRHSNAHLHAETFEL